MYSNSLSLSLRLLLHESSPLSIISGVPLGKRSFLPTICSRRDFIASTSPRTYLWLYLRREGALWPDSPIQIIIFTESEATTNTAPAAVAQKGPLSSAATRGSNHHHLRSPVLPLLFPILWLIRRHRCLFIAGLGRSPPLARIKLYPWASIANNKRAGSTG